MTTSKRPILPTYSLLDLDPGEHKLPHCTLKWRQKQLLVGVEQKIKQPYLPAVECKRSLVECLKHSPIRLVRIDPDLGEANLQFWADACAQANKAIFLRLPAANKLPKYRISQRWIRQLLDRIAAALLLLVLSPIILTISCLIGLQSPEPIFSYQWCVGERGRLFRQIKFRTVFVNAQVFKHEFVGNQQSLQKHQQKYPQIIALEYWIRKYSLDELPQLFNVLRGEMSLVGRTAYTLYDAVQISPENRQNLNALPGILGFW